MGARVALEDLKRQIEELHRPVITQNPDGRRQDERTHAARFNSLSDPSSGSTSVFVRTIASWLLRMASFVRRIIALRFRNSCSAISSFDLISLRRPSAAAVEGFDCIATVRKMLDCLAVCSLRQ